MIEVVDKIPRGKLSPMDVAGARVPLFDKSTGITSIGSCFANNVGGWLERNEYTFHRPNWGTVFSPPCIRQVFEMAEKDGSPFTGPGRWWPVDDETVEDPMLRRIHHNMECVTESEVEFCQAAKVILWESKVVIITLGMSEVWQSRFGEMTFYRIPPDGIFNEDQHFFQALNVDSCVQEIAYALEHLWEINDDAEVILTVSPVPLWATFQDGMSAIEANEISKSTLRLAAHEICETFKGIHYFPSYEIVRSVVADPYKDDNRHIKPEVIAEIMKVFEWKFRK